MIGHLLNRTLEVHRVTLVPDGAGGQQESLTLVGELAAMVSQPTAAEQREADVWAAQHSHTVYFGPSADVRRGDELRGRGQTFRVLATVMPSRSTYLKAYAELTQSEGAANGTP